MDVTELFSFIKDFGFPMVLSWFLLVRMENKLAAVGTALGGLFDNEITGLTVVERASLVNE